MARSMELKGRLTRIKKSDSQFMDGYLREIKHYPFPLSFDDLRPKLLLHEQRLKSSKDGSESSSHNALVAVQSSSSISPSRNNSGGRNREKNNRNRGGNNGRNQNNWGNGGNNNNNNSRGSGNNNNNNANRVHSNGHQAAYCPQRFNSSFVPCSSESVTRALAALSVGGEANDSFRYPDSGAASHMTPQDDKTTGEVLLRGSSKQGVYPLQPIVVPPESTVPAFLATKESGDVWHARLGYRCFDPTTNKVFTSRHVHFHEHKFPYRTLVGSQSKTSYTSPQALELDWSPTNVASSCVSGRSVSNPTPSSSTPPLRSDSPVLPILSQPPVRPSLSPGHVSAELAGPPSVAGSPTFTPGSAGWHAGSPALAGPAPAPTAWPAGSPALAGPASMSYTNTIPRSSSSRCQPSSHGHSLKRRCL
ncbi:uncharacterized protein LOC125495553 [Beta vulgaris subsp. vulgaris]|uniref:uncharacterized protein LOC125495553 n=1 Tax=Beta vulgaris subsp. vulgaris TaxID=3555 RepID=UPI0025485006|nr:uncharacterized protein LOC125495553 [Beta vulgaris subsp. vulgaris]